MTHASLLDVFRNSAVIYAFKGGFQFCCTHARNSSKHSEWKLGVVMVIDIGGNIAQGIYVLLRYPCTKIIFALFSMFINNFAGMPLPL